MGEKEGILVKRYRESYDNYLEKEVFVSLALARYRRDISEEFNKIFLQENENQSNG